MILTKNVFIYEKGDFFTFSKVSCIEKNNIQILYIFLVHVFSFQQVCDRLLHIHDYLSFPCID